MANVNSLPGINTRFDGFNINNKSGRNHHDEGYVEYACNRDDWFKDNFDMAGRKISDHKYQLEIAVNSEAQMGLWNDGRVVLTYDDATNRWNMKAFVNGREWTFCNPAAAVSLIVSGLACFASDPASKKEPAKESDLPASIRALASSIEQDANGIVATASRYMANNGCNRVTWPYSMEETKAVYFDF
ncbi:MAG: hypothetical protein V2A66_06605 [Pseudomonadota bacterium]